MPGENNTLSRRRALQIAGAAGAASMAGCSFLDGNGNGDGDENLGERVPSMTLTYFTGHAGTPFHERVMPLLVEYWGELGLDSSPEPTEVGEAVMQPWNDERVCPLHIWNHSPTLPRLDPETMMRRFKIDFAGQGGDPNTPNYADCETSAQIDRIQRAPSPEVKEEATFNVQERISEALAVIPMMPAIIQGAWNTDVVDVNPGAGGSSNSNSEMYNTMTTTGSETVVANASDFVVERLNMLNIGDGRANSVWTANLHSPLYWYDENFNHIPVVADGDYEVSNEGRTFTVDIKEDFTFQNGDDLTAEDVKWTFELLRDFADEWPYPASHEGEIEAVDTYRVEFTFPNPTPSTPTLLWTRWGIMHPDTWGPITDDPTGFDPEPEDFVGSGPYQVVDFERGNFLSTEPHEDHPVYSPESPLFFQGYENTGTAVEGFLSGEVHLLADLGGGDVDRVREGAPEESTEIHETPTFVPDPIYPQMQYPPSQFREFRLAVGTALNLEELNEIARFGASEPEPLSNIFMDVHPFRAPDNRLTPYTSDTSGDIEEARQILADEGWGWDSNGRLHYPEDKDLNPRWPEGEGPQPDDFECIGDDGEYVSLYDPEEDN